MSGDADGKVLFRCQTGFSWHVPHSVTRCSYAPYGAARKAYNAVLTASSRCAGSQTQVQHRVVRWKMAWFSKVLEIKQHNISRLPNVQTIEIPHKPQRMLGVLQVNSPTR